MRTRREFYQTGDRTGAIAAVSCAVPAANPPFVARYLQGELAQFFELPPGDVLAALSRPIQRPRGPLASALRNEAQRLDAPAPVFDAIDKLARENSRVVVTGQQAGLLLGPAYTLSKAMSAIALARELDSEERPVVPVFWVASQDHDSAEIDHAHVLDEDERLHALQLPLPEGVPSGRLPCRQEWLPGLLQGLEGMAVRQEHRQAVAELLQQSFSRASSFADLFSAQIYRLLGDQGLIVLDPTRPEVAELFCEVLDRELTEPTASVDAIVGAGNELRAMGLSPQLGRGKDATNLFIEEETQDGLPQRRLLRFDGRFYTGSRQYDLAELRSLLCDEPWRVTPAAGLRPVVQDALLPTAAFVVGPGELRYLAQLRGVYRFHGVPMPLAWPRASSVVLEPPTVRILDRYRLDYAQYVAERESVLERVLLELHGHSAAFELTLAELDQQCQELRKQISSIDPTLEGTVERTRQRVEQATLLLRQKAARALAERDEVTRRQFDRLEAQLFPGGTPQERYLSPFSFFLKFGVGPMMSLYRTMGSEGEHLLYP